MRTLAGALLTLSFLAACASAPPVDMDEPRRLLGAENGVRVDAHIRGEQLTPGMRVPITWEITNERSVPIAVAELLPVTSFDPEANLVTITIGSEVPGNELLPRLIEIGAGEKRSFSGTATMRFFSPGARDALGRVPAASVRIAVNFLGESAPFRALIGIQENAISDRAMADQLFPLWLERNEVVYTNAVPMRWGRRTDDDLAGQSSGRRRRN
jgi:hypothetical protein